MNGPLVFKSNVNVHLEKGAILDFSTNESDYLPAVITRWEGTELFNYSPLIYAYHVQNIALTGEGTVNGNGSKKFSPWNNIQTVEQEMLRKMGRTNVPVYRRIFGEGYKLRPGFIEAFPVLLSEYYSMVRIFLSHFHLRCPHLSELYSAHDMRISAENS